MSASNFESKVTRSEFAKSILHCGYKCNYWNDQTSDCNAMRYHFTYMFFISKFTLPFFCSFNESDNKCELAYLDYLEDPASGQTPKLFYIDYDDVLNLHMYCRGGEHCCHRNHYRGTITVVYIHDISS